VTDSQKQGVKQAAKDFYQAGRISLDMTLWAMKNAGYSKEETAEWLNLTNKRSRKMELCLIKAFCVGCKYHVFIKRHPGKPQVHWCNDYMQKCRDVKTCLPSPIRGEATK
jgi:sulfatase maturation enzyme AslB (radical SAM superfamily)